MRRSQLVILIVLCALFVSACGSSSTPAQPTVPPTATRPPATATAAPTNTPAPSPTPQSTATSASAEGRACLVGATWQLSDMSEYFTGVMSQAGNGAEVIGQTGTVTYVFGNDGVASVEADNFQLTLQLKSEGMTSDIIVSINGQATANFTLTEPDKITFSDPQMGDLSFSATVNGIEVLSGTPDEMAAMFGVSPDPKYNTFTYTCSDTTLSYTPPVQNARPLIFKRVP